MATLKRSFTKKVRSTINKTTLRIRSSSVSTKAGDVDSSSSCSISPLSEVVPVSSAPGEFGKEDEYISLKYEDSLTVQDEQALNHIRQQQQQQQQQTMSMPVREDSSLVNRINLRRTNSKTRKNSSSAPSRASSIHNRNTSIHSAKSDASRKSTISTPGEFTSVTKIITNTNTNTNTADQADVTAGVQEITSAEIKENGVNSSVGSGTASDSASASAEINSGASDSHDKAPLLKTDDLLPPIPVKGEPPCKYEELSPIIPESVHVQQKLQQQQQQQQQQQHDAIIQNSSSSTASVQTADFSMTLTSQLTRNTSMSKLRSSISSLKSQSQSQFTSPIASNFQLDREISFDSGNSANSAEISAFLTSPLAEHTTTSSTSVTGSPLDRYVTTNATLSTPIDSNFSHSRQCNLNSGSSLNLVRTEDDLADAMAIRILEKVPIKNETSVEEWCI